MPPPGRALFAAFAVISLLFGAWLIGQWLTTGLPLATLHPGYFLPSAAGGLITAQGCAALGWDGAAHAALAIGLFTWLLLGTIIVGRLVLSAPLPPLLSPTLAILAAPPRWPATPTPRSSPPTTTRSPGDCWEPPC